MKTKAEIKESIELAEVELKQLNREVWSETNGWIEALKWVIEDAVTEDGYIETEDEFWTRLVEHARSAPPVSQEEIIQKLKDSLESPNPFYKYLKDKSNEN